MIMCVNSLLYTIKNCAGSGILLYFYTNKLTNYWMLTEHMRLLGQKQKTLLLLAKAVANALFVCVNLCPPPPPVSHSSDKRAYYECSCMQLISSYKGNTGLGNVHHFHSGNKPDHFLRRDVISPLCANTTLKNILGKESDQA